MADGGTVPFQAGQEPPAPPYRPRGAYAGHELFGQGTGAVLVEPEVARDLRLAAEFATQEGRIAGGLLYGRTWADDEGAYLVVDGFLEAGPGENRGDQISRAGTDDFTLSAADLELLRQDAARMYTAAVEVGWWRSRPGPGEFGTRDLLTQRELVGPDGVGLLVFGSGPEWGAAYAGPNGRVPGPGASLAPALPGADPGLAPTAGPAADPDSGPAPETGTGLGTTAAAGPATELVQATAGELIPAATTELAPRRQPALTPAPQPTARVISPVRVPAREWGVKEANPGYVGPEIPTDVKVVVGLLMAAAIVGAVMIGVLVSNALVAVIVAVAGLLGLAGFLWMSHL